MIASHDARLVAVHANAELLVWKLSDPFPPLLLNVTFGTEAVNDPAACVTVTVFNTFPLTSVKVIVPFNATLPVFAATE